MRVLVTGGLGFIGSAVVRHLIERTQHTVLNVDRMTYAASGAAVAPVAGSDRYQFRQTDIADASAIGSTIEHFQPDAVLHLAAETHVDRSIDGPEEFVRTNVFGTLQLLEAARRVHSSLPKHRADRFRFVHVSTDEVFGALGPDDPPFTELTPYAPRSPYSASKASADHLARAWSETYGLPAIVTNCSNNFGPFQFPEKMIPLMIIKALEGRELPVYGSGRNVRDWLHVDDHAAALVAALERGAPGATYLIGGNAERTNLDVVECICDTLDEKCGRLGRARRRSLIRFVPDRPGHDFRYAIDSSKARAELGWSPKRSFEEGLDETIDWYLVNHEWWRSILASSYDGSRLGVPVP